MSIIIDGVTIPNTADIIYDGVHLEKIICDGVVVWEKFVNRVFTVLFSRADIKDGDYNEFIKTVPLLRISQRSKISGSVTYRTFIDMGGYPYAPMVGTIHSKNGTLIDLGVGFRLSDSDASGNYSFPNFSPDSNDVIPDQLLTLALSKTVPKCVFYYSAGYFQDDWGDGGYALQERTYTIRLHHFNGSTVLTDTDFLIVDPCEMVFHTQWHLGLRGDPCAYKWGVEINCNNLKIEPV